MRQSWETMTSVSAGHIILTPTKAREKKRVRYAERRSFERVKAKKKESEQGKLFYSKHDAEKKLALKR